MGRIANLLESIKNSPKKFGFNSSMYRSLQKTASEYAKKIEEPVTKESVVELSKIEEDLKKKTADYLQKRKNPLTKAGKARYNIVEEINGLVGGINELKDFTKLKQYQAEGKRLSDVVEVARKNRVVNITNKEKKVVGAGASQRIKFEYENETGFFTPSTNMSKDVMDVINAENERLESENFELWTKMSNKGLIQNNFSLPVPEMEKYTDAMLIDALSNILRVDMSDFNENELKEVANYYKNLGKADTFIGAAERAKTMSNNGVEKRNTATSRVASMLGMEDKIAVSENIKVINDGIEIEGSFMKNAVGVDTRSREGQIKLVGKNIDLNFEMLQRDINRMQVFDMLCGQIDRHGGNFFYQISETPINGKYQVVGLQGIDNDMSFGMLNINTRHSTLPGLDSLNMIDEEMLTSLRELTAEQLEFTIGGMISQEEVNAVMERRNAILEKVDKGEVRVIKANEWGDNTLEDSKKSVYYQEIKQEFAYLEINKIKDEENIVDSYDLTIKRIEEYNKKHPDTMQELPEKPKNYDLYKEPKEWRKNNSQMVDYEKKLATAKLMDSPLPNQPEGYERYKAEKEIYDYIIQKQFYEEEFEKTGEISMEIPAEPENFAERRKALSELNQLNQLNQLKEVSTVDVSKLQPQMDAYKEDFENNFEKQMEDYEKQVKEATSAKKPLPKMPAGYLEYKRLKDIEKSPVEVSLDELSGKSKTVTRMQSNDNQPKREMGMAPNGK